MRYIRFLKPPKTDGKTISALITITSDLGESFFAKDAVLAALVRSEDSNGDIYLRKSLKWEDGMRTLPITFNIEHTDLEWPVRVHVGLRNSPDSDHFENHQTPQGADLPNLISAWSDILDPPQGIMEARKMVERRFTPLSNRTLSIWEETGESIARHIWDAGVALSAYLDRLIALQAEGADLLERQLGSATYKKLNVIELGCGCGMVGLSLAQTIPDCSVLLTDVPEAAEIVSRNISGLNPAMSSKAGFEVLDWEKPLPATILSRMFDLILVADCTYNPDSSPALVNTLVHLLKRSPRAIVVVAMKVRHPDEAIFHGLIAKAGITTANHLSLPLPGDAEYSRVHEMAEVYVYHSNIRPHNAAVSPNRAESSIVSFWNG